jgi:sugar phosphate permease
MADLEYERGVVRPLPLLQRLLPGVFYGWFVVVGASVLSFVTVGIGFYGMPVLLDGLTQAHGWSRSSLSGASSLFFVTAAITGSLVGRAVDRYGARGFILVGAGCLAAGLVGVGRVTRPGELYVYYPLMAVGFAMSAGVPTHAILTRWFVARRALAMAIGQTGVSVGGMLLVPISIAMIESRGLVPTVWLLAFLVVIVAVPITLFVLRFDPRAHGLRPDNGVQAPFQNVLLRPEHQLRRWRVREALATRAFWLLAIAFASVLFAQQGFMVHQITFLRAPLGAEGAAFAVSTTAAGSAIARLVVGSFADRVDKRKVALGLVAMQVLVYVLFAVASTPIAYFVASLILGFTIGNLYMLQSLLVGEIFGLTSFGTVLGMLQLLTQVAGGLGPFALGSLYDWLGSYDPALFVLAAVACLAALSLSALRPPTTKGTSQLDDN